MPLSIPGRFNRAIQKFLSIKGPATLTDVGGEILTVFPLFFGTENRFLESWDRFGVTPTQAAVAAQRSTFQIRNPLGSRVIAVLERIFVIATSADQIALNFLATTAANDTDLAATITGIGLESRGRTNSTCIVSAQAAAGAPRGNGPVLKVGVLAGQTADFIITDIHELPLAPGSVVEIAMDTANIQLRCGFLWRERAMEESELAVGKGG